MENTSIKQIQTINYFLYGPNQSIINVNINNKNINLLNDVSQNDNIIDNSIDSNVNSIEYNNMIIHPLYTIDDICIKSDVSKGVTTRNTSTLDIYAPTISKLITACKVQNYIYALTPEIYDALTYKKVIFGLDETNLDSYNYEYTESPVDTYIYKTDISSDNIQDHFEIDKSIKFENEPTNIPYNYLVELQADTKNNKYISGDIYGNAFQCKNVFNSIYSMEVSKNPETSEIVSDVKRSYIVANTFNDTLYLTYLEKGADKKNYQHVETIESINRFTQDIQHKSTMYSLQLDNINLDSLTNFNNENQNIPTTAKKILEIIKDKIELDIKNTVRTLTKTICPANTELFDVFIN